MNSSVLQCYLLLLFIQAQRAGEESKVKPLLTIPVEHPVRKICQVYFIFYLHANQTEKKKYKRKNK